MPNTYLSPYKNQKTNNTKLINKAIHARNYNTLTNNAIKVNYKTKYAKHVMQCNLKQYMKSNTIQKISITQY